MWPLRLFCAVFFTRMIASFLIASAAAHFTMIAPKSRGSDELTMDQSPYGGFNVAGGATVVKSNGTISLAVADTQTTVVASVGLNDTQVFPFVIGSAFYEKKGRVKLAYDLQPAVAAGFVSGGLDTLQAFQRKAPSCARKDGIW
ncbi:hypothetical protein EDD86DRAFT_193576 [Gorgonomyces haynaldii]|nr:hypothetical protein EDD86DRAFT_196266 [Gorgonomyces haynaldii]KAI8905986.1 hypothetical protein EDD86DRAFT_193576 [Gorgonomyces haynaldii]